MVFDRAEGSWLTDESGNRYLDFFAGAGGVNYGHNNPHIKGELLDYLTDNRVVHSLDMSTVAKRTLLEALDRYLLTPRGLDYRVQFTGPTGAATVEAALELARKVTGRHLVLGFENSFHGMSLGAMSVSDNAISRSAHGVAPLHQIPLPHGELAGLAEVFAERRPAAVIVETVQGEGGVNVGSAAWLRDLSALCREHGVLLIVDDIQVGCGRTGPFFSFESTGDGEPDVVPDIVCLSKSLSGYGLPLALTLIRADLDVWSPGEHSGTFRGHNLAFITAAKALQTYWADDVLEKDTLAKGELVRDRLAELAAGTPWTVRGVGLVNGLVFPTSEQARAVCAAAFARGLLVETAGERGQVVKLMPPLTTTSAELEQGLDLLAASCAAA